MGGSTVQECERLCHDDAVKRVLGSERIPQTIALGRFLAPFETRRRERHGLVLKESREEDREGGPGCVLRWSCGNGAG